MNDDTGVAVIILELWEHIKIGGYLAVIVVLLIVLLGIGFTAEKEGYENGRNYMANEWCMAEGHEQGAYDQEIGQVVCANALVMEEAP